LIRYLIPVLRVPVSGSGIRYRYLIPVSDTVPEKVSDTDEVEKEKRVPGGFRSCPFSAP